MNLLLFARARDLLGADQVTIAAPQPANVSELRHRLIRDYPAAAGLLAKSAFAINGEFAGDDAAIPAGAEVALLPPVSGG